jgi:tryptophanyl-tRNA synthetase
MRAVTDTGPTKANQELSEPLKNLFTIMSVVSDPSTIQYFRDKYASCDIRYGDLKKQLGEDIVKFTDPIRERISEILADNNYLSRVVSAGAEKARASASGTIREVREIIGYKGFR